MTSNRSESDRLESDSEVIAGFLPLVDVLLAVLSVTLVAAGVAQRKIEAVPVELPRTAGGETPNAEPGVTLTIDDDGRTWIGDRAASAADVARALRDAAARGVRLTLTADAYAPFQAAAEVLSAARAAGVKTSQILVRRRPEPKAG